jgi:hypothetical protein
MSGLGKTRRRIVDISGGYPGMISDRSDQFLKFLESNSEDAFTRPWHRLEKGMRLNRIRRFVDDEALRFQLNEDEKTDLFNMLIKALDKKQLNSKSIVNYDCEQQKILEIKGLHFHKTAEGRVVFQIVEKRAGTMRKKAQLEPKQPTQSIQQE